MGEIALHREPHVSSNKVMVVTLHVGHIVHKSQVNIFASWRWKVCLSYAQDRYRHHHLCLSPEKARLGVILGHGGKHVHSWTKAVYLWRERFPSRLWYYWYIGNCEEELPKKPVGRLSVNSRPTVGRLLADRRPTGFARNIGYLSVTCR